MSQTSWLCLQTTTGKEFKLSEHLQSLGVEAYAPRCHKTYSRAKLVYNHLKHEYDRAYHNCTSTFPFFPSYLFASPEYYERRLSIKCLPVSLKSRVIGEIDDYFIETLREREANGVIVTEKAGLEFGAGEPVLVNSDSFRDVEAIFLEHCPERDRIKLLMTMMGAQREVTLCYSDIQITRPVYA